VTFFSEIRGGREILEPNIYIPQALGRAVLKKHGGYSRFFVLAEKTNQIYKQKDTLTQRAESYFYHRSCRSEASRRKRENSKI